MAARLAMAIAIAEAEGVPPAAPPVPVAEAVGAPPAADGVPPAAEGAPPAANDLEEVVPLSVRTLKTMQGQDVRWAVFGGAVDQTRGGLKRTDLMQKPGTTKVISKQKSEESTTAFHHGGGSKLKLWNLAVKRAKDELGFTGRFVPIGGESADGKLLKARARILYAGLI